MADTFEVPPDPNNPYAAGTNPGALPPPGGSIVENDKDARMWAMLCHLASLTKFATAFGGIIGPLIVWIIKKDQYRFVDDHGKESLNFQISLLIYYAVSAILLCAVIGVVLLPAVAIFDIVFVIIASVKANSGESYRYPLTIRMVK